MNSNVQLDAESARIKAVYDRRKQTQQADRYSFQNASHLARIQEIERQILRRLQRAGNASLQHKRILEIGCGFGFWLRDFIRWGARPENLFGIDVLEDRILLGRELCPASVHLETQDARQLAFRDSEFDIVFQMTAFTSILDFDLKRQIARQMLRVLKPGGLILWYDFFLNSPGNQDVQGISKKEILKLFPGCRINLRRITLAPPISRFLFRISPAAHHLASALRILDSHYLGTIHPQ